MAVYSVLSYHAVIDLNLLVYLPVVIGLFDFGDDDTDHNHSGVDELVEAGAGRNEGLPVADVWTHEDDGENGERAEHS